VFTDGRFRNEVLGVKRAGGVVLRIDRPIVQDGFSDAAKLHASETEQSTIPAWWFDDVVKNDGSLEDFRRAAVSYATFHVAR
jgi:hypothetical protein